MRFTLKTLFLSSVILAVATIPTTKASAEPTVKVPFSFSVGNKLCPAGTYSVIKDQQHALVTFRSIDSDRTFRWILVPGDPSPSDTSIALQFDGDDHNHTLRSNQYGPLTTPVLDKNRNNPEHPATTEMQGQ